MAPSGFDNPALRPDNAASRNDPSALFPGPLAQPVEQLAFNQLVAGSTPARPTIYA